MRVFHRAKGGEGVAVALVDGRAGQPEEEGVGQRRAHADAKLALLRAVCLVHQHDDVRAGVEQPLRLAKLENGRDDDLAAVLAQQLRQFLARLRLNQIGNVGGVEGGADLRVQVDAVHGDDHGGVAQARLHAQLLRGEDHEQRFARPLKMPDQPFLGRAGQHALHDAVGPIVLLIAADDLEPALLLVRGKEREVGEDVEQHVGPQQRRHAALQFGETAACIPGTPQRNVVLHRTFCGVPGTYLPTTRLFLPPRPPQLHRHVDRPVAQVFALGRHAEDIAGEEFRHEALVVVVHLERAVHPTDRVAHRRLGLDEHQREAVDQQDEIGAALGRPGAEDVLRGDDILVLAGVLEIDQPHRDMFVVGAKGHGTLPAQPRRKLLVGADQPVAAHAQYDGAQLVEHLVGALRLRGNVRVETDERLAHERFDKDILRLAGQGRGRRVMPARAAVGEAGWDVGYGQVCHTFRGGRLRPAQQVADHGFDSIGLSEVNHSAFCARCISRDKS